MKRIAFTLGFVAMAAGPALAHPGPSQQGSYGAGFLHPLLGADHILAMVGVGLWAVLLGGRAIWLVPGAFVMTMMAGFGLALSGLELPLVEPMIGASVVVLGLLATTALQVSTPLGMMLAGFFALFHGHAHGVEVGAAGIMAFMLGFSMATVLLHAVGAGLGAGGLAGGAAGRVIARLASGMTVLSGLWMVAGG